MADNTNLYSNTVSTNYFTLKGNGNGYTITVTANVAGNYLILGRQTSTLAIVSKIVTATAGQVLVTGGSSTNYDMESVVAL